MDVVVTCLKMHTYMRGNKIRDEIQGKAPPDSTENVTCDLLHSPRQADTMVDFWEELEQEDQQKNCHYHLNLFLFYQLWHDQPKYCLHRLEK